MVRDQHTKSGCMTIALFFLGLFLAGVIILVVQISNYINKANEYSKNYYCNEAQIPTYVSYIDRMAIIDFKTGSKKSLESKKGKDAQALIGKLPYGFSDAVTYALTQGETEQAIDIGGKEVTRHYIPEDQMPLDNSCETSNLERYYCVIEYPDGSCRFAIIVEITDPDI